MTALLNTLPTDSELATLVYEAQNGPNAVVGRYKDQAGEVVVFTDLDARNAWVTFVGPFEAVGVFTVDIPDPGSEDQTISVEVAYGRY